MITETRKGMSGHQSTCMQKDEWLTPPDLIKSLGVFDLDPCSPINRPWDTAKKHFTVNDDGLKQQWEGRVWCNPPYGYETSKWLNKCCIHKNAIALIFARTETLAWKDFVWGSATSILFLYGRLVFHNVDGSKSTNSSGAPSALVAYDAFNSFALASAKIPGKFVILKQ